MRPFLIASQNSHFSPGAERLYFYLAKVLPKAERGIFLYIYIYIYIVAVNTDITYVLLENLVKSQMRPTVTCSLLLIVSRKYQEILNCLIWIWIMIFFQFRLGKNVPCLKLFQWQASSNLSTLILFWSTLHLHFFGTFIRHSFFFNCNY